MRRRVTITFDNGPMPEVTPYVLDCLARNDVPATFFVVGRKASSPEGTAILQRASEEGHCIGNHTFTHTTPLGELERDAALARIRTGRTGFGLAPATEASLPPLWTGRNARPPPLSSGGRGEVARRALLVRTLEFRIRRLARPGRLGRTCALGLPLSRMEPGRASRLTERGDDAPRSFSWCAARRGYGRDTRLPAGMRSDCGWQNSSGDGSVCCPDRCVTCIPSCPRPIHCLNLISRPSQRSVRRLSLRKRTP